MRNRRRLLAPLAAGLALASLAAGPAAASHSWGTYHWARNAPFTLKMGDNVTSAWDGYRLTASSDWAASSVLDTENVAGTTTGRLCRARAGRVEVCSASYGGNGWLGVASIWATGDHITQGTVKLNDTYFKTAGYDTPAWRASVMCQEIGHTLGLGHNDEDFSTNSATCMDYSNNPVPNQKPNTHDYQQLADIYAHADTTTTVSASTGQNAAALGAGNSQAEWGRAIRSSSGGRPSLFERDLGDDQRVFTFVIWAD